MFKYISCLVFAVSCASARTMSVQVSCGDGVTTSAQSASCLDTSGFAFAGLDGGDLVFNDSFGFSVLVDAGYATSASATFADDYVFTVTGGTGAGFFVPCMEASTDDFRVPSQAHVGFGIAGLGSGPFGQPNLILSTCLGGNQPGTQIPFVFGVPQTFTATASGSAGGGLPGGEGDSQAGFRGFQFFDTSGNQLTSVHFTLVSTSIPEPSAASLLGVGLMFILALVIRGMRCLQRDKP